MQHIALGCVYLVGDLAVALFEEFFNRRRQQQHGRVIGMRAHGNDGIRQQRHQLQQLLILLAGSRVG